MSEWLRKLIGKQLGFAARVQISVMLGLSFSAYTRLVSQLLQSQTERGDQNNDGIGAHELYHLGYPPPYFKRDPSIRLGILERVSSWLALQTT
jgi:hypothetical protein